MAYERRVIFFYADNVLNIPTVFNVFYLWKHFGSVLVVTIFSEKKYLDIQKDGRTYMAHSEIIKNNVKYM